jgi:uncharacterized protein
MGAALSMERGGSMMVQGGSMMERGGSMVRLSSYAILSTRLKNNGYAIFNGLSGAIDIINEDLYSVLHERQDNEGCHRVFFDDGFFPEDLREHLLERGHLTAVSHDTERERLANKAAALHERSRMFPSFTIVPDTDCNYRCVYCFEKHLQNNNGGCTAMGIDKVESIFRAIDEISGGKVAPQKRIALYGGEPLNEKNRDVVYRIVETGKAKGYCFFAITNGHCIDTFLPLMGKGGIEEIQVTIDGSRHIHDKRRVTLDQSSSYDKVVANLHRLVLETDTEINMRVNADEQNIGSLAALFTDLEAEGLLGIPQIVYYVSPVHGPDASVFGNAGVEEALEDLKTSYPALHVGSARRFSGDAIFYGLLEQSPSKLKSTYCGATSNLYIFLPDGRIASCLESLGKEENAIGHYSDSGVTLGGKAYDLWMNRSAANIPQCLDCRYCLVCSGGCPQQAMNSSGSLYTPNCGDFQESYPVILADAAERFLTTNQL